VTCSIYWDIMDKYPRFAGIGQEYAAFDQSRILLQSIPYDGTSTWGKGADKGFQVFLEAAENMELYDIETGTEVYKEGIHIVPAISVNHSPGEVYRLILNSLNWASAWLRPTCLFLIIQHSRVFRKDGDSLYARFLPMAAPAL